MKALVVAGTHSGCGKTTTSLALMAALKRRGLVVQAFKVGPDFIDPGHHTQITGRFSHNLDGWMLSKQENLSIFHRYAASAEVAVVEGVMGLYDGFEPLGEAGSTAQMAKWLDLPVLLCIDSRSMARSLAAVVHGYTRFDPDLTWAGIVANRVGSQNHRELLTEVMKSFPDLRFWGGLARESDISMPERHLGLITSDEQALDLEAADRLADWLEAGIDLDRLLASLPEINLYPPADLDGKDVDKPVIRLGVARDEAFCFYYSENLHRLENAGAELVYFSPIRDTALPDGLDGLYIGGGYPELFARELARNVGLREEILYFGRHGGIIYAECGGFMYLGRQMEDTEGNVWPMVGLMPMEFGMLKKLKALGYRQVTLETDALLGPKGLVAKGHEFHYSEIIRSDTVPNVYSVTARGGRDVGTPGFMSEGVLASYVHLHFGSCPELAENLVQCCRNRKQETSS